MASGHYTVSVGLLGASTTKILPIMVATDHYTVYITVLFGTQAGNEAAVRCNAIVVPLGTPATAESKERSLFLANYGCLRPLYRLCQMPKVPQTLDHLNVSLLLTTRCYYIPTSGDRREASSIRTKW